MSVVKVVMFVCGLAGCGQVVDRPAPAVRVDPVVVDVTVSVETTQPVVAVGTPPVPPVVVLVAEGGVVPEVRHGDRLDVLMAPDGGEAARCDHMGGRLVGFVCEDVDF